MRPQERPQRRRGPHPAKQAVHPAVAQQVHVLDAVGTGDHPGDHRRNLQVRVHATGLTQRQLLTDQARQTARGSKLEHRRQAAARPQIRIIECH